MKIFVGKPHVHKVSTDDDEILTFVKSEDPISDNNPERKNVKGEGDAHKGSDDDGSSISVKSKDVNSGIIGDTESVKVGGKFMFY